MPRTIRYHLDEHCPSALAEGLRRRGIDVTTAPEAGLLQASDETHLMFARNEARVIFTQDADFLRLASQGIEHAGITYCHPESRSLGDVIRMLVLIWELFEPAEMLNRIEYL